MLANYQTSLTEIFDYLLSAVHIGQDAPKSLKYNILQNMQSPR